MVLLFDQCIQRVSLPDGKLLTQTIAGQNEKIKPNAWFATKYLINQDSIFYTNNGANDPSIRLISLIERQTTYPDKKYSLLPKLVLQNVLVVVPPRF